MNVEVKNLFRSFDRTIAVNHISFSFHSGEIIGFVGPNGAGKTTTMRILATLDEPTSGDATIDGVSIIQSPEKAREKVGFVPDNLPVQPHITVDDYLDFFARAAGLKGETRHRTVEEIEEFTNLTGIRDKFLVTLSKGMKQRVSLARALINDPPVLVMDEPAAGLDPRARIELRELLRILAARGKAILISSHILTELSEICTGAIILEQGKLLRAGTMAELVTSDLTTRTILIKVMEQRDELLRELLETPLIENARILNGDLELVLNGGDLESFNLLRTLLQKNYPIFEFRARQADLESVFMNITQGGVQ